MRLTTVTVLALIAAVCGEAWAGGERPALSGPGPLPRPRPIARRPFVPHAMTPKNPPSPAPYRPIGWGFNCHEAYGPTYYYPSVKSYEGLHPQYYPFFHPRLWPNYKTDALEGGQCGASRSCYFWDSYDDWMRDSRYGERQ